MQYDFVKQWAEQEEEVRAILDNDGPKVVQRLMGKGHSLREMGRRIGSSPAYLSRVKSDQCRICKWKYLELLRMEHDLTEDQHEHRHTSLAD